MSLRKSRETLKEKEVFLALISFNFNLGVMGTTSMEAFRPVRQFWEVPEA